VQIFGWTTSPGQSRRLRLIEAAQTLSAVEPGAPGRVKPDTQDDAPADAHADARGRAQAQAEEAAAAFRQNEQAETARAERALELGEFAALVAHEINQPITAILLNCNVAQKQLSRPHADLARVRESLQRIERDVERAGATIQRIRALVTNTELQYQTLDLNHLVEEALGFLDHELNTAGVAVVKALYADLPRVSGDRVQVQQVLINLFANAIEAMRSTPAADRVLTVGTGLEGQPFVTVRDTGPGIAPEARKRLFDPMFTTKPGGIGLGLSVSRSIVETHGGRLWAAADASADAFGGASGGACFCFTLRAASAEAAKPARLLVGEGRVAKARSRRVRDVLRA
jgi:signal transduction histidine kinase